jgi:hypothetical protein
VRIIVLVIIFIAEFGIDWHQPEISANICCTCLNKLLKRIATDFLNVRNFKFPMRIRTSFISKSRERFLFHVAMLETLASALI